MWILVLIGAGVLSALVHLYVIGGFQAGISTIFEIIVLHQFIVTNGLIGVLGFYINIIKADDTASPLGWPGGPFQIKYGFPGGSWGYGVLSIWFKGPFWLGTLITMYIYGAADCGHILKK